MPLPDLLTRIDALKAEWQGVQPLQAADEDRLWQKLRLEWNYNSNHIEGNTLTYGETELLLIYGKIMGDHTAREIDEMRAHDVAIKLVRQWAGETDRPLREGDVRDLNKLLLKEPFWKEALTASGQPTQIQIIPGQYKKDGNVVRRPDGSHFHYAAPEEVPALMADLTAWYQREGQELHPIILAAEWHHRFILIHPFGDGNGRVARLVVNYILMRAGMMPLVVKSADKGQYFTALQKADAGEMSHFAEYLAKQVIWSLELGLKAAKGGTLEERGDWVKEAQAAYQRTVRSIAQEEQNKVEQGRRVEESLKLNLPLIIQELNGLKRVYEPFYKKVTLYVDYELASPSGKYGTTHSTLLKESATPDLIELLQQEYVLPQLSFRLKCDGDALGKGARDAWVSITYKLEEAVQRFQCELGPSTVLNKPFSDQLLETIDKKKGEERPYGLTISEHPLEAIEKAGKWLLQQATGA